MGGTLPPLAFLFSIAGLSVTLAGFSGLVAAFRRGATWQPLDSYRLRQIPEMGLTTAAVAVVTVPLMDTTRNPTTAIQIISGVALLFTFWHIVVLLLRARRLGLQLGRPSTALISVIDITVLAIGTAALTLGGQVLFEWLLVTMLMRPMVAFVLVLTEIPPT